MDLTGFDRSTRISSRSVLIHGKLWIPHPYKAYYDELIYGKLHPLVENYIDIDHVWCYLTVLLSCIVIAIIWACTPTNGKIRRSWLAVNLELLLCKLQITVISFVIGCKHRLVLPRCVLKIAIDIELIYLVLWSMRGTSIKCRYPVASAWYRYENLKVPMEVVPRTDHRVMGTDKFGSDLTTSPFVLLCVLLLRVQLFCKARCFSTFKYVW